MTDRSFLGIDLRVCSVKVVELKKTSTGLVLQNWGMEDIPYDIVDRHPDKETAQAKALQKIITDKHIKTKEAIVVVGGPEVLVKRLSMPDLSGQEAHQAIKWKIKDELGYPVEEALVEYVLAGPSTVPQEKEYLIAAVKREVVNRVIGVMRTANIKLVSIIPVPISLELLHKSKGVCDKTATLVYMGRRTTNISFFKNCELRFNREIQVGGEDITKAMTAVVISSEGRTELSYDQAEKMKREFGIPLELDQETNIGEIPSNQLYALIRPAMERVENEILRTVEYFKSQEADITIDNMYITGGSSKTPHLLEFLSKGIGFPFEELNALEGIALDANIRDRELLTSSSSQLSCAIGAGLSGFAPNIINLAPEELREEWRTQLKKHVNPIEVTLVVVVIFLIFYLIMFFVGVRLQAAINESQQKLTVLKPKLVRLEQLEKAMKEEEGRRGIFTAIELSRVKMPRVLENISAALPPSILVESINFVESTKQVAIKGVVFSRGGQAENILSKFILDLSNMPSFEKVDLIQVLKTSGYAYEAFNFEVDGVVKK